MYLNRDSSRARSNDENMTRFFINLGRKDKLNPASLIGLINDQKIADKIEIGAIDILDTFSFFEIDKNFEKETLDAFGSNDADFNGRSVNIEITKSNRGGGGGGRKPRGGGGGFSGRRRSSGNDRGPRSSSRRSDSSRGDSSNRSDSRRRSNDSSSSSSSRRSSGDGNASAGFGRKRKRD